MKFTIKKNELLRQLPQGAMPEVVVLEGTPFEEKPDKYEKRYKDMAHIFSRAEWRMFVEMLDNKEGATITQLLKFCAPEKSLHDNIVAVHILNMRKKIIAHGKKWVIVSVRKGSRREGMYKLVKTTE